MYQEKSKTAWQAFQFIMVKGRRKLLEPRLNKLTTRSQNQQFSDYVGHSIPENEGGIFRVVQEKKNLLGASHMQQETVIYRYPRA